jgi:hypothetical protein
MFKLATAIALTTMMLPFSGAVTPAYAQTKTPTSPAVVPVAGTVTGGGTFSGTMTIQRFTSSGGQIFAVGSLAGTLTTVAGEVTSLLQTVSLPVTNITGSCQILHLDIGPVSLNLLGLQVNLSRIVLDITAQTGAGNLLGNLLCSVANLLNDPNSLVNLLNQILAAL